MKANTVIGILVFMTALFSACTPRDVVPVTGTQETTPVSPAETVVVPPETETVTSVHPMTPGSAVNPATEASPVVTSMSFLVQGPPPDNVGPSLLGLIAEQSQQPLPDQTQPLEFSGEATIQKGIPIGINPWCASDAATVESNVQQIAFIIEVDGETHNLGEEFGWEFIDVDTQNCAIIVAYLIFPDPGEHQIKFTVRIDSEIYDGTDTYQPGNRVYNLNLTVQ